MARRRSGKQQASARNKPNDGATTGHEAELWAMADDDIARIARTYHAWRSGPDDLGYDDIPGFCKSAALDEVRRHGHVLTPGRDVGAEPQPEDGEPFEARMRRLVAELQAQQAEGVRLGAAIAENLRTLGLWGE